MSFFVQKLELDLELRQAIMETLRVLLDEAQEISIATAVTGVVATAMILTRFE